MDTLFLILLLISLTGLIVGLVKPTIFSRILEERATRKKIATIFGIVAVIFFILFAATNNSVKQTVNVSIPTETIQKQATEVVQKIDNSTPEESRKETSISVINFSKLREWSPDNDSQAVGLEILVSKEDVTKDNILRLVESITSNTQKAVIKIYQNKKAWEEETSGNYTGVYDEGYLAFYVKNLTNSGAYRGVNEVRWMQEKGILQDLFFTKTKLK